MNDAAPASDSENRFLQLRQGHLLTGTELGQESDASSFVLVSQTCDIVLDKRPTVSFASVCELGDDELARARKRDNPRYVALPMLGDTAFADLSFIQSVPKTQVAEVLAPIVGINLDDDIARREFALAIGRWFSRFAFPDEVVPWLRPVLGLIRDKYDRPDSPLGKLLNRIVEFRVEASDWQVRPLDLTLHVVVPAGSVPTLDDPPENPQLDAQLRSLDGTPKAPGVIAERILALTEPGDIVLAWGVFVESLGAMCVPKPKEMADDVVAGAVIAVTGMLWGDDEFPLARVRSSEILDLDYLSAPVPYAQ